MPRLVLRFLGAPQYELDGALVNIERRKTAALLAYLAVEGGPQARATLGAWLWPEHDQSAALAYMRRALWDLNETLGSGWLHADRETLSLESSSGLWVDVVRFRALLSDAGQDIERLQEAVALYRGDFLAGFSLSDSAEFEEWQTVQAESLRRQFAGALQALVGAYSRQGESETAIAYARRWLALDRLNEAAHRELMALYAGSGQRNAALRQYEECARLLRDDLGVAPDTETIALFERIKSTPGVTAAAKAPPAAAGVVKTERRAAVANLPLQPTPFIGREHELEQIAALLADPACRLLTLNGPGGIGKTRLAIEAAQSEANRFSQGAYFVPLAALSSPDLIVPAIAEALKISVRQSVVKSQATPDKPAQVAEFLRDKQALLVLDNFEHLAVGAGALVSILAAAPGVKMLVTSRERLNLQGEWVLDVDGMPFPEAQATAAIDEYGAVQLFWQAARRAHAGFTPSAADSEAASRICRLLAGMPLAIELAAAWVAVLSCEEIAAEIGRNLDFLTTTQRDVPERHRSLRAVFERSWGDLGEAERSAYRQLSVFRGGFTRQAAAQVAGVSLAMLSSLANKSLLRRSGAGRYDMHEVLKRYAAEKLDEAPGERRRAQDWHSGYYLGLLADHYDDLRGPRQKEILNLLSPESDNLRVAWEQALAQSRLTQLRRAIPPMVILYEMGGRLFDLVDIFQQSLGMARSIQSFQPDNPDAALVLAMIMAALSRLNEALERHDEAMALLAATIPVIPALPAVADKAFVLLMVAFGGARWDQREFEALYGECIEILSAAGDRWSMALAQLVRVEATFFDYGTEGRISLLHEALRTFDELGDRWGAAMAHNTLSQLAYWDGEYAVAYQDALASLALYRELGEDLRILDSQMRLGIIATAMGDLATARSYLEDNLEPLAGLGLRRFLATNLDCLGYTMYLQGDLDGAEGCYQRSVGLYKQLHETFGMAMVLNNLGDLARARRRHEQARDYYERSLAAAPEVNPWPRSIALKNLGKLYLQQGDLTRGEGLPAACATHIT